MALCYIIKSMKTVLLVEDDKFLSTLLKNRLEKEGFNILYAADGEEAINVLRASPVKPDLVLLDIILPKKNPAIFLVMQKQSQVQPQIFTQNLPKKIRLSL